MLVKKVGKIATFCFTLYITLSFQYNCYKKVANYYKRWPELPHFVSHCISHCIFGIIVIKRWASLLHLFQTRYTCYKKVARIDEFCFTLHITYHTIFSILVIKRWATLLHLLQIGYTCYKMVAKIAAFCFTLHITLYFCKLVMKR